MDRLEARNGFLPGLLGRGRNNNPRSNTNTSTSSAEKEKMQGPGPSPMFKAIPRAVRTEFVAMVGEFIGTFMFL